MQFTIPTRSAFTAWTFLLAVAAYSPRSLAQAPLLEVKFNLLELPSSRDAQTDFAQPVLAAVDQQPLGKALNELSRTYQVALWLDRRVDRSRLISYSGAVSKGETDQSALARLRSIAKLGGAEAGLVENVLYVGPADQVAEVQRAAVRLHDQLSRREREAKLQALAWDDITTHSELLMQIESQWNVTVTAQLPHDLMHAGELPRCTLATQLTLLCAGFALQVRSDSARSLSTEPLDLQKNWQATYPKRDLQLSHVSSGKREFPGANATIQGSTATVVGTTDFHLHLFAPPRPAPRNAQELKFSIPEINAPLAKILGDLSKQLGMTLQWDPRIPEGEKQALLRLHIPQPQTLTEVLQVISRDAGVTVSQTEQTITVAPKKL